MRKILSRFRALFRPSRRRKAAGLTPAQHRLLRRNLRELLFSKEFLSEQNENAA